LQLIGPSAARAEQAIIFSAGSYVRMLSIDCYDADGIFRALLYSAL